MKKQNWARCGQWIHERLRISSAQLRCGRISAMALGGLILLTSGLSQALAASDFEDGFFVQMNRLPQQNLTPAVNRGLDEASVYLVADDPSSAGCYCTYKLPNCQGPVNGRVVDECYPLDGVSLQENVLSDECGAISSTTYNCADVLGQGARCALQEVDCCGVVTQSAICTME